MSGRMVNMRVLNVRTQINLNIKEKTTFFQMTVTSLLFRVRPSDFTRFPTNPKVLVSELFLRVPDATKL